MWGAGRGEMGEAGRCGHRYPRTVQTVFLTHVPATLLKYPQVVKEQGGSLFFWVFLFVYRRQLHFTASSVLVSLTHKDLCGRVLGLVAGRLLYKHAVAVHRRLVDPRLLGTAVDTASRWGKGGMGVGGTGGSGEEGG